MRQSNIYVVKQYEVEEMPAGCTESGKTEYSSAVGLGISNSIKEALAQANKMLRETQNGGCGIMGNTVILKGGVDITHKFYKVYNPYSKWSSSDQRTFESFLQRYNDSKELERLIAEEI